eukprot:TRINITY_DN35398_c0_g1_i1.p1 TRINITY_DN35398_c0_g1~~TRINITY_DN35398_c0_g1_i1.p1  ORF type:complete len:1039 (+),score=329.86 TRINITY_DN35398_c0_g1_i1:87-3119(+)
MELAPFGEHSEHAETLRQQPRHFSNIQTTRSRDDLTMDGSYIGHIATPRWNNRPRPAPTDAADASRAGGPAANAAHLMHSTPAESLKKCLQVNIKRFRTYRGFVVFLLFLIFYTVAAGMMFMEEGDEGTFHMTSALRENLMEDAQFKSIRSPDDFYDWMKEVSKNFWVRGAEYSVALGNKGMSFSNQTNLRTHFTGTDRASAGNGLFAERQNYPLHFMMVRQRRIQASVCGQRSTQASPLRADLWSKIQDTCLEKLSKAQAETGYIRQNATVPKPIYSDVTTDPFEPDFLKVGLPPLRDARGLVHVYQNSRDQYSLKLPYDVIYLESVESVLSDLKANSWIDYTTRLVVIETMVYNAVRHEYVVMRYVLEFTYSGQTTQFSTVTPYWLFFFDSGGAHTFYFVCDILATLYLLFGIYELIWSVRVNQRLDLPWLSFWEVLALIHLLCLAVCLTFRFYLWFTSQDMGVNMPGDYLYDKLLKYEGTFAVARHFFIATLWLTWLRLIEFLRFNRRLNAVTETIRLASQDLFSLMIITCLVTLGFSFVANMIYGAHIREFNTIGDSVSWLLRTVFSGDLAIYYQMRDLEPVWTPIFLLVYLIMAWLILLNVVLGILAAGFNAASSNPVDRSWSFSNIKKDVMELLQTSASFFCFTRDTDAQHGQDGADAPETNPDNEDGGGSGRPSSKPGCLAALFGIAPFYKRRLICVAMLREYIRRKRTQFQSNNPEDVDFHATSIMVSADQLCSSPGWPLNRVETLNLIREANTLTAESFASAEEAKRREKDDLINSINMLALNLQANVERMLGEAIEDIDGKMGLLDAKIDNSRRDVQQLERNIDGRIETSEERAKAENNRVIVAVCSHRKHMDNLAASLTDSELRTRGDRRPYAGLSQSGTNKDLEEWRRELEEREERVSLREKKLEGRSNSQYTPPPPNELPAATTPKSQRGSQYGFPPGAQQGASGSPRSVMSHSRSSMFHPISTPPPLRDAVGSPLYAVEETEPDEAVPAYSQPAYD